MVGGGIGEAAHPHHLHLHQRGEGRGVDPIANLAGGLSLHYPRLELFPKLSQKLARTLDQVLLGLEFRAERFDNKAGAGIVMGRYATVVINNAGALTTTSVLDEDAVSSLEYLIDVNVSGLIRVAQAFAPVLRKNGGGALAQVNSVVSIKAFAAFTTYSASKAASYSVTQALREQLQAQGTHVISIHPGPIATDMGDDAGFTAIAEPPSVVAETLFDALEKKQFHVFPDSMARTIWEQYVGYARNILESETEPVAH